MSAFRPITVFAPAKINLYLHVARLREDGYHDIDSLAVFADIGDRILIEPANDFTLLINGPFAGAFTAKETDSSPSSSNLVTRAVWEIARAARRDPKFRITLTKNLPLASGLGGGSSDAAATIWGLMNLWSIPITTPLLPELMADLGADIPACLRCAPVQMSGIGDILDLAPDLPEIPVVLVNPGKHCPTAGVFRRFIGPMRGEVTIPEHLSSYDALIDFLTRRDNDLTPAATELVPDISQILNAFAEQKNCGLSRMTGSGATVFGLFEHMEDAKESAEAISLANPRWWVRVGTLNSPERY
ncbi:MAG: 4-(cytidine 5'-diphospho)-2-C-methyl-D-erythritol kinase [Micavibrio sp.]